ncbi:MAG: membrane protein insertase YidC [Mycoplasmataceae bacterium]|nr:membrane protein insertase YidC [Mycoplasmataceae bacterium]
MNNKNNEKHKKSSEHSFYKEANKSILGQQQMTPKKIGKIFAIISKWLIFGFLIVATLWGCVNQFIIKTVNNLGQGIEFYQKDDFIYPNMYSASEITGYTKSNKNGQIKKGIKDFVVIDTNGDGKNDNLVTESFNINIINPNFKAEIDFPSDSDLVPDELQVNEIIINASDVKTATYKRDDDGNLTNIITSFKNSPSLYSYNLNELTASLTGIFDYDWTNNTNNNYVVPIPFFSLPKTLNLESNSEIEQGSIIEENNYKVSTLVDFVYFLLDKKNTLNGLVKIDESIFIYKDDFDIATNTNATRNDVASIKISLLPNNIHNIEDGMIWDNWTSIAKLNVLAEKDGTFSNEALKDQAKTEINKLAFKNGIMKSSYKELPEEFKIAFDTAFDTAGITSFDYNVDFSSILNNSDGTAGKLGENVFGGAQVIITPINKGFPIEASSKAKSLIDGKDGFREQGYRNAILTENKNQGFDSTTQMYGWMLLDGNNVAKDGSSDILRTYSESDFSNPLYSEDNYFYADQRRNGWGSIDSNGKDQWGKGTTVFDEKIKQMMQNTDSNFIKMSASANISGETITTNYASTFAGMTSLQEIQTVDESFTGTLPALDGYNLEAGMARERSILSDSAIASKQDSWGENRVAFVGLSDWGKAWNVQFGPLYGAFVFPLAQISMGIGELFSYASSPWGTLFSIFIIVFLTRGLGALLSLKGTKNQMKMQEVQTEVAKIKSKYSKYDLKAEPKIKQKQQSEIMALYRKHEVNPMGSLGTIFVTMPIFISLWIIISALPSYKLVIMGNFSWAVSAWYGIFNLGTMFFLYLLVGLSVGLVQGVSSKLPSWLANKRKGIKTIDEATKASMKKQNRTQNIMVGVFVFMGLTVPALFAFYWITSGFFTIILELIRHAWRMHVAKHIKLDPTYKTPIKKLFSIFKIKFSK